MIPRTLEPEVMDDPAGAEAYARADFSEVNQAFVDRFLAAFPAAARGRVVDLGCGPADIPLRLARTAPGIRVVAADASAPMLARAREALAGAGLADRVSLVHGRVPGLPLKPGSFDAVISNSILHHLPDPAPFWAELRRLARPGAAVFVMDLFRPESPERAREIVEGAAKDEHPILKQDFYNSLLAAFTLAEVKVQLAAAELKPLRARIISDRHWLVTGTLD